ncbi:hypothetical protein [Endozoicomonas elysicola]|uniref:Uncharacterized protein n=1 Tax=Endozoicomonas elysicola TaxID=305900 RepID=A0A081K7X1_9GAMM|nr:hypothetical protein [Endozoicomonas elysicola]KEI70247.1 hypothetical protein GV64_05380 [Endozoicomonas elysicola]
MKSLNARLQKLSKDHGSLDEMIELHRQALEWLENADPDIEEFRSVSFKEAEASFYEFWEEWQEVGLRMPSRLWGPNVSDMMDLVSAREFGPENSPASYIKR